MAEGGLGSVLLSAGAALGGLGLFLLAVGMITDGLKTAAGNALRDILGRWTSTTWRGVLAGAGITALVQSSSAVTVATIGFVNAGLLPLYQALGVIYGANVGTTMTGWLVAAVGFEFKLELYALPMVGLGMALRLLGGDSRRGAIGQALAGFGLFFIGLDVLKEAFEGLDGTVRLDAWSGEGLWQLALYVAVGFFMTLVTQSSSAAIAITLTAATGGVVSLAAAAAMVIGANVGTTSTAGLAVIGATSNAKRVAAAHLVFNLLTGAVALLLLPGLLWLVGATGKVMGLQDAPAVFLALFHTVFNLLGVAIMLPLGRRLSRWLAGRFRTQEEIASRPQHLDPNVLVTPVLALNALVLETERIGRHARAMARAVLSAERQTPLSLQAERRVVNELVGAAGDFVTKLQRHTLPENVAGALPRVLRAGQYYLEIADLALDYANERGALDLALTPAVAEQIGHVTATTAKLLTAANPSLADYSSPRCIADAEDIAADYRRTKEALLGQGVRAAVSVGQLADLLEQLRRVRRMAQEVAKAGQCLDLLMAEVEHPEQVLASKEQAAREAEAETPGREQAGVEPGKPDQSSQAG